MSDLQTTVHEAITDASKNQWNNLVKQNERGSLFERYEWLKAFEESHDVDPRHIVVTKDGNPVGLFPGFVEKISKTPFLRLNSSTGSFGGPIISSDEEEVFDRLLSEVESLCSNNVIGHQFKPCSHDYQRYGYRLQELGYEPNLRNCRFVLRLNDGWEEIKANMSKDRRYNIRKATEQDYRVDELEIDSANIAAFHSMHEANMERVEGSGIAEEFLQALRREFEDRIMLLSAVVDGHEVGQNFYLVDEERSAIHHLCSGLREEDFEYYPAELLHRHAIKWGIENDYRLYDFGGTKADWRDGIFQFKSEFGGDVYPTVLWEKGYSKFRWRLYKIGRNLYTRSY